MGNSESTTSTNNNNKNSVTVKETNQNYHTNTRHNIGHVNRNINTNNRVLSNQCTSTNQTHIASNGKNTINNHVYAKMTPNEYSEYQKFLLSKQSIQIQSKKKTETINKINNNNIVQNSNNNNGNYKHSKDSPIVSSNDVNDQFTQATNDRIYRQPNAPYHPQPRMDISLQSNSNYTNVKDDYQNIYQQRQFDINKQYLHTLHQNGEKPTRNSEFERTQHEMDMMKKQQSLLFTKQGHNDPGKTQPNNATYKQYQSNYNTTTFPNNIQDEVNNNRRDDYVSDLDKFAETTDPYILLNVTRDTPMRDITRAYRKLAKVVHPDKGGDEESFNKLTKAYLFLLEQNKGSKGNQNFHELKQNCNEFQKTQTSGDAPLGKGDAFNQNLFNKIYEENRLWENKDEGYTDWINQNKVSSTDIDPVFSKKFNINVFNTVFNELKDKEIEDTNINTNEITKYTEPTAAYNGTAISYTEIGEDKIDDFGKSNTLDNCRQLAYTDYRQAMTSTHLINTNNGRNQRTEYKNIDELERERDNIKYDMSLEERQLYDKHLEFKKVQEDNRLQRTTDYDQRVENQYHRVNNLLGQSNTKTLS